MEAAENNIELTETLELASSSAIYQQDKAQIDVQIATAKAFPRNVKRSIDNAIAIVTMDRETAATCTYSVPRGGKAITGESVHLAKILSQVWGNLRVEAKVVGIDSKQVTSEAVCFDLENNLAIKAQVKRSIMTKNGRMSDDMITVTGNAANAIALRNAILSVIPKAIVTKVYTAAKNTITGDVGDKEKLIARRKQVFDGFKDSYGLTEKQVLASVGKAAIDHVTADDLVVLIGIGQAIKDGDTTVDEAFLAKNTSKQEPKTKEAIQLDRQKQMIEDCKTLEELMDLQTKYPDWDASLYTDKKQKLIQVAK